MVLIAVIAVLNSAADTKPNELAKAESVAVPETVEAFALVVVVASELVTATVEAVLSVIVVWLSLFSFLEITDKYC